MGFRDDGEAVRARAEALARQLEEKDARVAGMPVRDAGRAA